MKEYYKIGEISKIYGIGKDSLMYYEKLGILSPIRDENSYRLYSISDIWKLNLIKELRELNFPMSKIKEYIDNRTIDTTVNLLNEEIELLDEKIKMFLEKRNEVKRRLDVIKFETSLIDEEIKVLSIPVRKAIKLNGNIKKDEEADFLIKKLHKKFEERFNILGNNNIGAVFSFDKLKVGDYNYYNSVFCFLENKDLYSYSNMTFEAGIYISCIYKGDYNRKKEVLKKMFDYMILNNYKIIKEPIEIYKIDIHETGDLNEFITEIQINVNKME